MAPRNNNAPRESKNKHYRIRHEGYRVPDERLDLIQYRCLRDCLGLRSDPIAYLPAKHQVITLFGAIDVPECFQRYPILSMHYIHVLLKKRRPGDSLVVKNWPKPYVVLNNILTRIRHNRYIDVLEKYGYYASEMATRFHQHYAPDIVIPDSAAHHVLEVPKKLRPKLTKETKDFFNSEIHTFTSEDVLSFLSNLKSPAYLDTLTGITCTIKVNISGEVLFDKDALEIEKLGILLRKVWFSETLNKKVNIASATTTSEDGEVSHHEERENTESEKEQRDVQNQQGEASHEQNGGHQEEARESPGTVAPPATSPPSLDAQGGLPDIAPIVDANSFWYGIRLFEKNFGISVSDERYCEAFASFLSRNPEIWREYKRHKNTERSIFYSMIKTRLRIPEVMRVRDRCKCQEDGGLIVPLKNEPNSPIGAYHIAVRPQYTRDCLDDVIVTVKCKVSGKWNFV